MSNSQQPISESNLSPMSPLQERIHDDLEWAMARYSELDQLYHGQYVLVWHRQVIAHGENLEELMQQADTPDHPRHELALVTLPAFMEAPH